MCLEVQKIQDFTEFIDLTSGTNIRLKRDKARNPPPPVAKTAQTRARTTLGHPIESTPRENTTLQLPGYGMTRLYRHLLSCRNGQTLIAKLIWLEGT
jgi:hypothetical protein